MQASAANSSTGFEDIFDRLCGKFVMSTQINKVAKTAAKQYCCEHDAEARGCILAA
jgi:hypothetical protein